MNNNIFPDAWEKCEYASLTHAKKFPWTLNTVANVGNYDYMTNIKIYGSTFTTLNNTDHGEATIAFIIVFGLIFFTFLFSLIHIEIHERRINSNDNNTNNRSEFEMINEGDSNI